MSHEPAVVVLSIKLNHSSMSRGRKTAGLKKR